MLPKAGLPWQKLKVVGEVVGQRPEIPLKEGMEGAESGEPRSSPYAMNSRCIFRTLEFQNPELAGPATGLTAKFKRYAYTNTMSLPLTTIENSGSRIS